MLAQASIALREGYLQATRHQFQRMPRALQSKRESEACVLAVIVIDHLDNDIVKST
jgi:hypothetical protein